jgi:alcohol dehydrogenase
VGDRVLVPAITRCGRCGYCQRGMPSHCQTVGGIGWILGHLIDGTQAELVRVPYADTSLYRVPDEVTDEQAIFLADSLPTGYEVGVLAGGVRPGHTVAVVGAGAVGLAAILTTGLWGASRVIAVDTNKFRLTKAVEFGATDAVEAGEGAVADVLAMTDGLGVDVAIEAVGYPETLRTAAALVRPGGTVANIGVHGVPVELPMQDLWIKNITLTMGLVDTVSVPTLLTMVASGRIPAERMGTHRFTFDEMDRAYDVFANAAANEALKVVITPCVRVTHITQEFGALRASRDVGTGRRCHRFPRRPHGTRPEPRAHPPQAPPRRRRRPDRAPGRRVRVRAAGDRRRRGGRGARRGAGRLRPSRDRPARHHRPGPGRRARLPRRRLLLP